MGIERLEEGTAGTVSAFLAGGVTEVAGQTCQHRQGNTRSHQDVGEPVVGRRLICRTGQVVEHQRATTDQSRDEPATGVVVSAPEHGRADQNEDGDKKLRHPPHR